MADPRERKLAEEALLVQDACNLAGVVHSYSRAMTALWEIAHERKQGTTWVNHHPVAQAYADKCAHLAGVQEITTEALQAIRLLYKIRDGEEGVY